MHVLYNALFMGCLFVHYFVIFFQGKTLFYAHHFSQTHERISPQELFEADPSLSLRAVILKVVSVINKVGA